MVLKVFPDLFDAEIAFLAQQRPGSVSDRSPPQREMEWNKPIASNNEMCRESVEKDKGNPTSYGKFG